MLDVRPSVPACPEHAGQGPVSTEDTSRTVAEGGTWLWRRAGWRVTYACGCRLELHGVPVINTEHPILRDLDGKLPSIPPFDTADGSSGLS